jgi:cellobiose phosphorylase
MYRLIVESLLGIRREGDKLRVDARLPRSWPGFRFVYRHGATIYRVEVVAAEGERVAPPQGTVIELRDDGGEHVVEIVAVPHELQRPV